MAVGNLDNVEGGSAKIAIGCFSGVLRVYRPSQREFRAEDLMLEQQLGAPILQIEVGIFSSHSPKEVQLAVLHPKRLCVYGMRAVSAGDEKSGGGFYQLSLLYKHNLTRSTFNFTFGPFGRADGKDYIAVQSLDGELTVIEQEKIAFSKFLPNFLVPGPLCYAPHPVDGFITVNSQFECQCFRYNVLTSSSSGMLASAEDKDKESKRAKAEWTLSIGESAYEICVARHTSNLQGTAFDIIVLGEHTIFWLDKAGVLKAQKRLDYIPTSMRPYPVASQSLTTGPTDNLIVSTSVGSMMVYNHDMHLVWAAQLPTTAVAVEICTVGKMRGAFCMIALCQGKLGRLGTLFAQEIVCLNKKMISSAHCLPAYLIFENHLFHALLGQCTCSLLSPFSLRVRSGLSTFSRLSSQSRCRYPRSVRAVFSCILITLSSRASGFSGRRRQPLVVLHGNGPAPAGGLDQREE